MSKHASSFFASFFCAICIVTSSFTWSKLHVRSKPCNILVPLLYANLRDKQYERVARTTALALACLHPFVLFLPEIRIE